MARFGFCGPTYQSESVNVDAQRAINLYPEHVESQQGRTAIALYQRPGLKTFVTLPGESSVPQLFAQNGRMFAAGLFLWEIFQNGTFVKRGNLNPALGGPVFITANQVQLLILSNGLMYLMDLTTNLVTPVNPAQFNGPILAISFCDGFFLAVQQNSQVFYTSNLLDGSTWLAVNASQVSLMTDNITSHIVSHRDVWFFGNKSSLVYYNSGAALSPFIPISGGVVEQGSATLVGTVRADNSILWWGLDERGALIAWRANAYTPMRISNHAVENAVGQYAVVSDAIAYSCQINGHILWVTYFPTPSVTWVYDVSTAMWHEWSFLDPMIGPIAHRSQCHCFTFNEHFVGDWRSGVIYQMSLAFNDDFGFPMQRLRRAPAVSRELEWMQHHYMQLDVETGLGPIPPLQGAALPTTFTLLSPGGLLWQVGVTDLGVLTTTLVPAGTGLAELLNDNNVIATTTWQLGVTDLGVLTTTSVAFVAGEENLISLVSAGGTQVWLLEVTSLGVLQTVSGGPVGRDPQVYLRWSDDGGHTWSNLYALSFGGAGRFQTRVIWRRLGRSRQRIYEVSCTDPVPFRIVDAYLKATPEYQPMERYAHQARKQG